jgi:hypothetical protein
VIRYPEASQENRVNELKLALIGPDSVATIVASGCLVSISIHITSAALACIPNAAKNVFIHMLPIVINRRFVLGSSMAEALIASCSFAHCNSRTRDASVPSSGLDDTSRSRFSNADCSSAIREGFIESRI